MNQLILAIHILTSLTAAGATATYFFWQARSVTSTESVVPTLQTIRAIELRFVVPAYVLAGITGIVLTLLTYEKFNIPWAELAFVVWIVLLGLVGFHSRAIKRQTAMAAEGSIESSEYAGAQSRVAILRYLQIVAVVVLVYLMVYKPVLWG